MWEAQGSLTHLLSQVLAAVRWDALPQKVQVLLVLCIWILSSLVALSFPRSLHEPLFLSFPPCFLFFFCSPLHPLMAHHGSTFRSFALLHLLPPLPPFL